MAKNVNNMKKQEAIQVFEDQKVRSLWDTEAEKWYFSIVDTVGVLTDSPNPNNYWKVLKNRLKKEGSQLVTDCNQLKMQSTDGKFYKTDVADTEQLFRLIQSIPSRYTELIQTLTFAVCFLLHSDLKTAIFKWLYRSTGTTGVTHPEFYTCGFYI